jgi:excisionase family DNA binding protein
MTKLLTPEEAANRLAIHRSTIRRMILAKQIPALLIVAGRRKKVFRIREDALERWVMSREKAFSSATELKAINLETAMKNDGEVSKS